jgi:DNA invertase Pin-like site-specific DNA recombinase
MSPKKVAKPLDIYVRVSDVRGRAGDSFISPDEQERRCRAAIVSRGLEVGETFRELDVSGKSMERPELAKACKRIEDGTSGGIVVARIDRFGRTVARALDAIEEIDKAGGVVITAEGDFDTSTATGELVLNMMLTLAQFELRRIRENWTTAQRRAVERGVHISRHVPPGYEKQKDGTLTPHKLHSKTISRAYKMAAEGASPASIARYLNERNLPSGDNGNETVWKASRIKRLLANRVYLGQARYGEIVNDGAHEALTDETTWLLAQRKQDNSPTPVQESSTYLLSGLCRCASCRHSMRPQRARGTTVGSYRCATETASGRCPHPSSVSMNRLEGFVYEAWCDRVFEKMQARETEPVSERDNSTALEDLEDAHKAVSELEAVKDTLRPDAYGIALSAALDRVEQAERAVQSFAPTNMDKLIEEGGRKAQKMTADFMAEGLSPEEVARRLTADMSPGEIKLIRSAMAEEIRAVFVRPAASRSKTAPLADRVRIVWADDPEEIDLPRRGEVFTPRPYVWASTS